MLRPAALWSETPSDSRWAVVLCLAVSLVAFASVQQRPITLVDPAACPGVLEIALAAVLRAAPGVPVGYVLSWSSAALTIAGLALFVLYTRAVSGGLLFAGGAVFAFTLSGALDPQLAPPVSMCVIALACLAGLGAQTAAARASRRARAALLPLAAIPVLAPPLLLPTLIAVAVVSSLTQVPSARTVTLAGSVVALTLYVSAFAGGAFDATLNWRSALACVAPLPGTSVMPASRALMDAVSRTGPLPFALALLGAFAAARRLATPASAAALAAAAALGVVSWSHQDTAVLIPAWGAVWCLVAIGLGDVMEACRRRTVHAFVALLLVLLVPALQLQHRRLTPPVPKLLPLGHDRLSSDGFWRFSRQLPSTALVREDAAVDLLLRATRTRNRKAQRAMRVIDRDLDAVRSAMRDGPVFVLPAAQLDLQHRGVRLEAPGIRVPGLAVVGSVPGCVTIADTWKDAHVLAGAPAFALIATDPRGVGPVELFMGSAQRPSPDPLDWPARARRGLTTRTYERARTPDLNGRLADLALPAGHPLLDAPFVSWTELWRTPGAPSVLPVSFGAQPLAVVARARADAGWQHLQLCPSFPHPVSAIVMP